MYLCKYMHVCISRSCLCVCVFKPATGGYPWPREEMPLSTLVLEMLGKTHIRPRVQLVAET
jgi:hypothetical protein